MAALCHPCEGVKVAACACVKSLSRSVKVVFRISFFHPLIASSKLGKMYLSNGET